LKPVLRTGLAAKGTRKAVGKEFPEVLDACHGEQGEKLRRNVEEMKRKYQKAWDDDREAKRGLNAFLERYVGDRWNAERYIPSHRPCNIVICVTQHSFHMDNYLNSFLPFMNASKTSHHSLQIVFHDPT